MRCGAVQQGYDCTFSRRDRSEPVFNFLTGHREYKGDFLKLGKDDILVLEGIHGLNDKLSYSLPERKLSLRYI